MIFYLTLFYLIFFLYKIFGLIETDFYRINECSVRLETEHGVEICLNQKCSDFKDPWRIINSHIQDEPCYLHYLKLSFTTYDQLLVFIELQKSSENSLDTFFADDDINDCLLEIEIDRIYPLNENYFLSENMLQQLGGEKGKINILQITILSWYRSARSSIQVIENDIIPRQPFDQITIYYHCNLQRTMERLILVKYLFYQEPSTCPIQIHVTEGQELFLSDITNFNDPIYYPKIVLSNIHSQKFSLEQKSLHIKNQNSNQWSLWIQMMIILIIIALVTILTIYNSYYSSSQSPNI